jgi:ABC-type nitrate/sulfonate/bicarbonate transport system substrate-binding protein
MMHRKLIRRTFALAAALGILAAVPSFAAPKLRLGAASNNGGMIVFAGVDRGIFAKHGIDAKVVVRNTGAQLTKSLKAGQIDFAPAAFTNLPAALERGIKVRGVVGYVGGSYTKPTTDEMVGIAIRPGRGINSIADLKGKKVGATFGSTGDLYLRTVLSRNGITKRDYRRINVRPPSLVSLFDKGGVDAMVAWEPYLTRMIDKVKGSKLIVRGGDYVCFCAGMHGVPETVYKDRKITQAFVNGMAEAAAWVRDPKNKAEVVKIGVRYVRGVSPELFRRTIKYWTYDPRLGPNTFKAFRFSVKQLIAQKKMKRPYDPAKYFDLTFINRTMKEHPEWFADLK